MSQSSEQIDAGAGTEAGHAPGAHETRDVVYRPIVWAGVGGVLALAVLFAMMRLLLTIYATREAQLSPPANPLSATYGNLQPPAPRLQTAPIKDLNELRAAEDAILQSYGWADRQAGTVRIPIDRAMDLLAQRGLPSRAAVEERQ